MNKLIALSFVAAVAAAVSPAPRAEAQIAVLPAGTLNIAGVPVTLGCKNPGSSQDVAKTPVLTNTSTAPIAKGRTLMWKSSDGDSGSVKLDADLAPGASIRGMGKAGNGYTCSSSFLAYPDLTIGSVTASSSGYVVKVNNIDKHAFAGASTLQLEFLSCQTNAPVGNPSRAAVQSLYAGGSSSVVVAATKPAGKTYLRISADSAKVVVEGNEANNVWSDMNSCLY